MTSQLTSRYNVVINGGGIVGFSLLNLILRSPHLNRFKVLLIEQAKKLSSFEQPSRTQKEQNEKSISTNHGESKLFSNRVSGITLASKNAFKQLGAWNSIKLYAKDIANIKVLNQQNLSSSTQNRDETKTVENYRLSHSLLDNLCRHQQITNEIAWNYKLQYLNESTLDGSVELKMENKETGEGPGVSADSVLGCDDHKSKVRELKPERDRECNSKPKNRIEELIQSTNKRVFVFMKGQPSAPSCGYSNAVVQILNAYGVEFDSFDVLSNDEIRQEVKAYSNWPTIPQVFVDGSFVGGCDILIQMHENNELESLLANKKLK